jgi:TRAP-type C4-dicarboxylate transport system permease large subunit
MKIDPVWFATVMILATQVGVITPPFAPAVYAVNAVADPDVSIEEIPWNDALLGPNDSGTDNYDFCSCN